MGTGVRCSVNLWAKMLAASLAAGFCFLSGCSKKEPEVDFKPLQLHWTVAPGQDENDMAGKDLCVIKITSRLLGEKPVQASTAGELSYDVVYGKSLRNAAILEFKGACDDPSLASMPECSWLATCDEQGNVVVKFNNGD